MSVNNDMTGQFALDMQGFQRMQHTARTNPEEGVKGAAQQFEALFVQMMVKSMREAIPESGLMNSQATQSYQSMMDQQWSQVIASRGVGLADALVAQLERQGAVPSGSSGGPSDTAALIAGIPHGTPRVLEDPLPVSRMNETPRSTPDGGGFFSELEAIRRAPESAGATPPSGDTKPDNHVQQFMQALGTPAQAASETTGVPAKLILAQAALETGWGRHEIATENGRNSHNLFGIKAGSTWQGDTTDITTHEYIDGRRVQKVDTFRVYDSFEHAFTDYAGLIGNNPRYAGVVNAPDAQRAAVALQQGGYATDPRYAAKLVAVMDTMGPLADTNMLAQAR
jgi:flagellar protein FlgJ